VALSQTLLRFTYRRLGITLLVLSGLAAVYVRVLSQRRALMMIDLVVYREGAQSLWIGRPLYEHLTLQNNLPFTYPPLSAWLAMPFAAIPFPSVLALWCILQIWAVYVAVKIAMRAPMVAVRERLGAKADAVPYLVAAALLWIEPVSDGIFFGQVNSFIVVAAMADIGLRRVRWPRGALTGLVTAVKLTPGVFWVHFLVSGQWRLLRNSLLTAGGLTIFVALVDWDTSWRFWTGAIRQPERLGANINTSNQSLRGMLMRLGEAQSISESTVTLWWVASVLIVGVPSFLLARRFHRLGDRAAEVGVVGLMAVLLSPVAWIHHLHWMIVLLPAVLGDGRRKLRWIIALGYTGLFVWRMPWTGHGILRSEELPGGVEAFAMVLQNGFGLLAIALLVILWRLSFDGHHQGVVGSAESRPAHTRAAAAPPRVG
jgi:alpha-1,2-mannosyltransferase